MNNSIGKGGVQFEPALQKIPILKTNGFINWLERKK